MAEALDLNLERTIEALRERNERLEEQLADAKQAMEAFATGEVDAVALRASSTPIMLESAQADLRRSQELLRAVFEGSLDAILLADDLGRYVDVNAAACAMFGLPREQLLGRSLLEFAAPGYDAEATYDVFKARGRMRGYFPLLRSDGTQRTLDYSAVSNVVPGLHLSVLRDITERKNAEDATRESRRLLEEAQEIAQVGSWTSGLGMDDEVHWTRQCCRIFGLPDGTRTTVREVFARVHPDDREALGQATVDAIERGLPIDIEHRVQRPDGRPCWVRARASVRRQEGLPPLMVGTVQDVTDRRAALDKLERAQARLKRIIEGTSEGVWTYDTHGVITFMNGRFAQMLGCAVDEAVGQPMFAFMDPSEHAAARERIARRHEGISESGDFRFRRADGAPLLGALKASALLDADGHFEEGLVLVTDVSVQRKADETRAWLAAIVESSEDAIVGIGRDRTITTWNVGAEKLYGFSAAEIVGKSATLLVPETLVEEERRIFEGVAGGEAVLQRETLRRRKDGSTFEVAVTLSPVRDADGAVIGISKIARDLTERRKTEAALRRTEEQFRQAQKMEAIGRLAGGVAHDFNNLLSVILSYSHLMLETLNAGDPLRADVEQVQRAAQRATGLTRQLLAFSRQQVLEPRVVALSQIVGGMKSMLARLLGEDIELTVLDTSAGGRVFVDPGQIEQVVMNLAVNARDAMPDGGKLTVETSSILVEAGTAGRPPGVSPGSFVRLAVSDTGTGMDAATLQRIFEPFFTTKPQGKGTGLGLATVFGIVQQSGGYVTAYSEVGHGTTFKVYLPRTDADASMTAAQRAPTVTGGSETILLVEDEDQVRAVACAILRRRGYHVLETSNGGEALLVSNDFPAKIDLLITDVVMPRMNGRKLAEQLAAVRPEMKVLFVSGYTDDAIIHHGVLEAGVFFLQKPFSPQALLHKVREILDAKPG